MVKDTYEKTEILITLGSGLSKKEIFDLLAIIDGKVSELLGKPISSVISIEPIFE